MKYTILSEYQDKKLDKLIKVGAVLELDDDRVEDLMEVGIELEEFVEDEDQIDVNDLADEELIEAYKNNQDIVDDLKADGLKVICGALDIEYTKADEIREHLKNHKPLEE